MGGNGGPGGGKIGGDVREGLDAFVVGTGEAEFVFEGTGWVEVMRERLDVGLGGGAGVQDGDVWAVDL